MGGVGWVLIRGWVALSMGAYSRWALIRGWALIRINTVCPYWFVSSGREMGPIPNTIVLKDFCIIALLINRLIEFL